MMAIGIGIGVALAMTVMRVTTKTIVSIQQNYLPASFAT